MNWIVKQKQVHMTIGSFLHEESDVSEFHNDVQMVKVGLLYADQSKLVSLPAFALIDMDSSRDIRKADPVAYLRNVLLWTSEEGKKKAINHLITSFQRANQRRHSKRGREELKHLNQWFAKELHRLQDEFALRMSEPDAQGLFDAVNSGLLEIHPFKSFFDRVTQETLSGEIIAMDYVRAVSAAASDTQTYPLFDEPTSDMISLGIGEGQITLSTTGVARGKEVALAADLLARLPLFERATVKEILDIRRELEKPLVGFRSAMINFSDRIQSASWDKDFPHDADRVFRSDVAPTILALEDEEQSNSFLNKLTAKVADKAIQIGSVASASAAISALAVQMLNLPLADVAALAAGPAIVAGGVAYSAYKEWKEQQQNTEGNSLFFYYKAGELLENRSFEYDDPTK